MFQIPNKDMNVTVRCDFESPYREMGAIRRALCPDEEEDIPEDDELDIFAVSVPHLETSARMIEIPCVVEITRRNDESRQPDDKMNLQYLFYYIHYLFLIMNVSVPGSCNFSEAIVKLDQPISNRDWTDEIEFRTFNLNSALFVNATRYCREYFEITSVDINQTKKWMEKYNMGLNSYAQSEVEKVLYSLLNCCMNSNVYAREYNVYTISNVVWLANAIEAFYLKGRGPRERYKSARSLLQKKLPLFFKTVPKNVLEENLKNFYDIRNKFVHGNEELLLYHPLEGFSRSNFMTYFDSMNFVFALLLSTVQKLVSEDKYSVVC